MDVLFAAALFDFAITMAAVRAPTNAKNPTKPRTRPTINPVRLAFESPPPDDWRKASLVLEVVVVDVVVVVEVDVEVDDDVELVLVL